MPAVRPKFLAKDVIVVLPTRGGKGSAFRKHVGTMLANKPCKIVIVTPNWNVHRIQVEFRMFDTIHVLGTSKADKRLQLARGVEIVNTPIVVFADDDVLWPPNFLHFLLAAFEDEKCGAAGTCQRVLRSHRPNFWHFLGAIYLQRRNFENTATIHIDGGISALSGRTQAIRTSIVRSDRFLDAFLNEKWLGFLPLGTADDDTFITRYMVNHDWKIRIQRCKEAELETTFSDDALFIQQCTRWFRTTWRSNLTSMLVERRIWK